MPLVAIGAQLAKQRDRMAIQYGQSVASGRTRQRSGWTKKKSGQKKTSRKTRLVWIPSANGPTRTLRKSWIGLRLVAVGLRMTPVAPMPELRPKPRWKKSNSNSNSSRWTRIRRLSKKSSDEKLRYAQAQAGLQKKMMDEEAKIRAQMFFDQHTRNTIYNSKKTR